MTAGATVVLLGSGAALAPIVFAEEAPRRALQAVTVDLASDGAITGLASALVSRGEDGEDPTTRTTALNPAEHAGDLPVRVTTSWRHDGRVGTDLADVEGVDGRVEISVTVQNLTGRPERFQYDANGVARESYEIVTTPMTVVASAVLPGDSAAALVRPQGAATEPGTTNGVISTEDDATTVQWASILAPPRLQPSTTFTLVQDAEDFELPAINLAVQPGVATDDSVARLVGDVFGGSARMVGSENHTIGLIANVNATLAQVTDSLQTVRETLAVNAGEVGSAATNALRSTANSVDASMASLLADLQALDNSVGATVEGTNSRANSALDESVRGVLEFFGSPTPASGPTQPVACGSEVAAEAPSGTLLGQLSAVSRQLNGLADASTDCVEGLRETLLEDIGFDVDTEGGPQECAGARSDSLVCQLMGAGQQLGSLADGVRAQKADIAATLDPDDTVSAVLTGITGLQGQVTALQAKAAALKNQGGTVPQDLDQTLTSLLGSIDGLLGVLAPQPQSTDPQLAGRLTALAAQARAQSEEMLDDSTGILAQSKDLAEEMCAPAATLLPGDPELTRLDGLSQTLVGLSCAQLSATTGQDAGSIAERVRTQGEAADALATALDTAADDAQAVADDLSEVRAEVDGLSALIDGTVDSQLTGALDDLLVDMTGLYDSNVPSDLDCDVDPVLTSKRLNALFESFKQLRCQRATVAGDLEELIEGAADGVDEAAAGPVDEARDRAKDAGTGADESLGQLGDDIGTQLTTSAAQQLEQGRVVVEVQTQRLRAVQAAAEQELDAAAQGAIGQLAEQISLATVSQSDAALALQEQLQKVLLDLGSAAEGRGLLGVIQNSAGQTGVRTEQVTQTSESAASFRGVRQAEVADAQLEQQQFARSLQAAQRMEPFAEELPAGSVSATVFCFRLGGEN
ncbi:hypothetical protein DQ244_03680 [Blastococcus sp. TBT05-19]|uniref:hypothetical protein n=1 Tax=Blastococcus sp. TBT05-19 TaxID=2250581 RepID=UPI000DEB3936|nr:hypothetical protein [Blastococcus sp. TBT05-19]RBY94425.1 hypothetical protein DQ244_03680 [Blastococcus sp. TBT05-19]